MCWCMCVCTKRETNNEDITRVEKTYTYTYTHIHAQQIPSHAPDGRRSDGRIIESERRRCVPVQWSLCLCRDFVLCRDGFFSVRSLRCADAARVNVYTSPALRTNGFKNAVDRCERANTHTHDTIDLWTFERSTTMRTINRSPHAHNNRLTIGFLEPVEIR